MEKICPLCNGLDMGKDQGATCFYCGVEMKDRGRISSYLGPYSPYSEADHREVPKNKCIHLFSCQCGNDTRIAVELINS